MLIYSRRAVTLTQAATTAPIRASCTVLITDSEVQTSTGESIQVPGIPTPGTAVGLGRVDRNEPDQIGSRSKTESSTKSNREETSATDRTNTVVPGMP